MKKVLITEFMEQDSVDKIAENFDDLTKNCQKFKLNSFQVKIKHSLHKKFPIFL